MIIKSRDVILRRHRHSDIQKMAELADNENVSVNLRDAFPHPYTLRDAENFIDNCLQQEPPTTFAIEYMGEYAGNIGIAPGHDVYRKSGEIGYFLGEPYWNKGIMTQAVGLIVAYGFKELGLSRIHTGIFEYNKASMRVLEKCGFELEGIFKKAVYKNGLFWDEYRYARIIK